MLSWSDDIRVVLVVLADRRLVCVEWRGVAGVVLGRAVVCALGRGLVERRVVVLWRVRLVWRVFWVDWRVGRIGGRP